MKKTASLMAIRIAVAAACVGAATASAEGIPVTPIAPTTLHGHSNALVLGNRQLEVTILPSLGRIAGFRFGGLENLLRFDDSLAESSRTPPEPGEWRNFGGDWILAVPQQHWRDLFHRHWPPPLFLDGLPWQGHAWISDDGAQHALLELEVAEPLHVRMQRAFRVDAKSASVSIRQRIERTAPSDIPMTLWNISQIPGAQRVLLPVDKDSAFPKGYSVLDFGPPAPHLLHTTGGGVLVLDVKNGTEHKLGSDSPRGWIAAQRDHVLIVEQAITRNPGGAFPDGGCRVEVYANSGLGYTEIETLSEERVLQPGEVLENTLTISFHHIEPSLDSEAVALRLRELMGEIPAPSEP